MFKVYKLTSKYGFSELNLAITNGDKTILTDNEAIHTIHYSLNEVVLDDGKTTIQDILNSPVVQEVESVGAWVRTFGIRIENNYSMLRTSIRQIGLNPEDFPRNKHGDNLTTAEIKAGEIC